MIINRLFTNADGYTFKGPLNEHCAGPLARKLRRVKTRSQLRRLDKALARHGLYRPGRAPGCW